MARFGMVIDLDRCLGCRSCSVACKIHNAQPPGTWWHRVETIGSQHHMVPAEGREAAAQTYLPMPCMHCDNPPCAKVCPVKATWKRQEDGVVLVDYERCIGCRCCMTACPYGVRQFNWQNPDNNYRQTFQKAGFRENTYADPDYRYGYPAEHRTKDGRLVYAPKRPRGVVEKCTFCVQYLAQGLQPACVQACPGNARIFGDLDDPTSNVSRALQSKGAFRLNEELGTSPKVFYLPPTRKYSKGEVRYEKSL